jgi:hypothetical protein
VRILSNYLLGRPLAACALAATLALLAPARLAWSQQPRFSAPAPIGGSPTFTPGAAPAQPLAGGQPFTGTSSFGAAQPLQPAQQYGSGTLTPVPQGSAAPYSAAPYSSGSMLGAPEFDPYSAGPGAANTAPSLLAPPAGSPYGQPLSPDMSFGSGAPIYADPGVNYQAPVYTPTQPGYVFPGGVPGASGWTASNWLGNPAPGPYMRLFQDLRFRYTFLPRMKEDQTDAVQVNNFEVATTLNYPNFLWSQQPLQVSPGFVLNLWDGPKPPATADLPAEAYDAYLNFGWQPEISPQVAAILNTRVGVFTDFNTFNSDSLRILGQGLLMLRLSPTIALKGGIEYFDRLEYKLLPAGGILWTPNERSRFDIYFPRPKLAHQAFVMGNSTVWLYLGADIGGGSWTIERTSGLNERVDMNDIRAFAGFEWMDHFGFSGFIEGGYVFDRELKYEFSHGDDLNMPDTLMIRAGIAR